MAEIPSAIKESILQFLSLVRESSHIEAAYLYGSHVRGTANQWSDIDIAIVSPDFTEDKFAALVALLRLAAQIDTRIEPVPFAPTDFDPDNPLVSEIQRTGIALVQN
ncbi:MAG: nucleotidyltransferase domain-containing protein [Anaerolineae bacterium]